MFYGLLIHASNGSNALQTIYKRGFYLNRGEKETSVRPPKKKKREGNGKICKDAITLLICVASLNRNHPANRKSNE